MLPHVTMRRAPAAAVAALLLVAVAPAAAQQGPTEAIVAEFERDGAVALCVHGAQELAAARDAATANPASYPPGFAGAVDAAIRAGTQGDCGATGAATPAPTPAPEGGAATPAPTPAPAPVGGTPTPAPAAVPTAAPTAVTAPVVPGDGVPAAAWALAGVALVLALLAALSFLLSRNRQGGERFAGVAHAWREAGHRATGAWLDFADWLRIGR